MRLRVAVLLALIAGSLAWVATRGLSENLTYFVTPTEVLGGERGAAGEALRLGGQVVPGSVHGQGNSVRFVVTDGTTRMTVVHRGGTPALFRSGIGVVLEGTYGEGAFYSDEMLVKHSEEYRPPEPGETPHTAEVG